MNSAVNSVQATDEQDRSSMELSVGPDHGVQQQQIKDAVSAFKEKLDPQWQSFFDLYFIRQLDYGEVAEHLNITKLRCKYMKKVLISQARKYQPLLDALGRGSEQESHVTS